MQAVQVMQFQSRGEEDPLEEEMKAPSSSLAGNDYVTEQGYNVF